MSDDINDLEHQKFIESTDVPGVKGIAIVNPDGSTITGGSGGSGNGAILDGVDTGIKASVLDYTNSNPLAVRLTDTNGDYIAAGAGTQYTEDAASPSDPIGTQIIARRRDSLSAETSADGDNTALNSTSKGELYVKHIDDVPVTNAGITTIAGAVSGTEMQVDVVTSALPTGASTSAKQDTIIGHVDGIETILGTIDTDTGNIATSTSSLDTKVGEVSATPTANTILARLKTIADNQLPDSHNVTVDNASIAVTNAGITTIAGAVSGTEMQVDVVSSALPTGAATAAKQPALGTAGTASSDVLTVQGIASMTALKVDGSAVTQPVSGTVAATQSGSWSLAANQSVNVAQINGVAATMGNGNSGTGVQRVTIAADSTGQVKLAAGTANIGNLLGGSVAHDSADSQNPIKVGFKATSAMSGLTLVASADRTDGFADLDGAQVVRPNSAIGDYVNGNASNTDGSSTQVLAAGAAGIKHAITDVTITNTSSSNIYVELKDGTTVKWTFPVPANSGVTHKFGTPIVGSAAAAWNFDPSAAATTVYCSVSGFKTKL